MSKGTDAGLLDEVKSQSVFKHAILNDYYIPFVTMTTKWITSKRAVLVDGFAGRGRYPNNKPASGEHMLLAALKVKNNANVEVVLVEQNPRDYQILNTVTGEYRDKGVAAEALPGDIADHIAGVVKQAVSVPLFLFLDPCGANVPFAMLEDVLTTRKERRPATEVLLNISADLTRRASGALRKGQLDHPVIARLNIMCGGDWWQQIALDAHATAGNGTWESAAEEVVAEYASRLGGASSMKSVVVPVRRKAHHQPVYHLVFLTRAEHGLWVFGAALSKARIAWLRDLGPDTAAAEGMLFNDTEVQIESEQEYSIDQLRRNMLALADRGGRVKLVDHTITIFGDVYGTALESSVRKAARQLHKNGQVQLDATPKQPRDWTIWK